MSSQDEQRTRRSLSHVGGPVRTLGDLAISAKLREALDVPSSLEEDSSREHVHGFHAYPARMHPLVARRLVEALSPPKGRVLDPFCGSGTVLVEARLQGREAIGVDANPLAVRLAELKVRGTTEEEREELVHSAKLVAETADARRKAKAGPSRRYGREDMELFPTHVLLELDGLRVGIDALENTRAKLDLELVLSAILTKVSHKTSDTSEHEMVRRIAAGYPARLFVRKTVELAASLAVVAPELVQAPRARVHIGDARRLGGLGLRDVGLACTSPPYPGNYDYLAHHAARLRWLRLDAGRLEREEIGARRNLDPLGPEGARRRWAADFSAALESVRATLSPDGLLVVLAADSVASGQPIFALQLLDGLARECGFAVVASASQPRPHFHGPSARAFAKRRREEHLVALAPVTLKRKKEPAASARR